MSSDACLAAIAIGNGAVQQQIEIWSVENLSTEGPHRLQVIPIKPGAKIQCLSVARFPPNSQWQGLGRVACNLRGAVVSSGSSANPSATAVEQGANAEND